MKESKPEKVPFNFGWIIQKEIAGMGAPVASGRGGEEEVNFLLSQGIRAVVSLTERSFGDLFSSSGFAYLHEPIRDMGVPSMDQLDRILAFMENQKSQGKAVVAHCTMGYGRTGTVLACYLVQRGLSAWEALDKVRRLRPGSVETMAQESLVVQFYTRHLEANMDGRNR